MSEAKRLPLNERLRWARKRKGFSHDTLAAKIGSSRRHLIRLEKGEVQKPGAVLLARIAVATDQPVDFFRDGDSDDDEEAELVRELVSVLRRVIAHETRVMA